MATRVRRQGPEWLGGPAAANAPTVRHARAAEPEEVHHVTEPAPPPTSPEQREHLERFLSGGRLRSYVAAAGPDGDPLDVYAYNMALASALLGPLHLVEVVTRNAMHELLAERYERRDWWAAPAVRAVLRAWGTEQLDRARTKVARAHRGGPPPSPDDVVAATDFGFWTDLAGRTYERTLWQDPLRHAFPHARRSRQQLYQALQSHRRLRNRVTHHEPIHDRDVIAEYERLIQFIAFVSAPVAQWVDERSRVRLVAGEQAVGRGAAVPPRRF